MRTSKTQDLDIITLGCRLNAFESEVMRAHAKEARVNNTVIVNTCAVTKEAARQARQTIRRTRRTRPDARIIVTGCAAQIDPGSFAAMPEVDQVLGNEEKLKAASYLKSNNEERIKVNDIMAVRETAGHMIDGLEGRARVFVQIQNGCDHRCTFCIIPFGRGPSRSVAAGEVVAQIQRLVDKGTREVVLTGVDMTSYGADLPAKPSLGRLVGQILTHVPDLPRLRLSSLDAVEVDDALFDLITDEPRLMPHLHLSLQSGDNMILKRMKRRHSREDAIDFCARLRAARPEIALGADLIAGFPTETDAMFENTLRLVEDCALTWIHIFPYSAHARTPAARMPQVPGTVIKARAARLREAGDRALKRHLDKHLQQTRTVLMEKRNIGRLDDFTPLTLAGASAVPGSLITAKVVDCADAKLIGERLECLQEKRPPVFRPETRQNDNLGSGFESIKTVKTLA